MMLLQELRAYTDRLTLPPALYAEAPVRYIIDLDAEGCYLGMIDTADPDTREMRRGRRPPCAAGSAFQRDPAVRSDG